MSNKVLLSTKRRSIRLIECKKRWGLTIQGWGFLWLCIAALISFTLTNIHPFLAVNAPIKADVLVVEGWLPDYAFKEAISELNRGTYKKLITTGLPLDKGFYLAEYKNFAELTAATFLALGVEQQQLVAVPANSVRKDRTFATAIAVKRWLKSSELNITSINLYSLSVHARRSWLLFQKVLAPEIKVGIIAAAERDYNPQKWWTYSQGVRSVISETIAYIYAFAFNWIAP